MTQTKLFKLLQKTITTLMCFWLLSTQMPINVVFADEINTEENIVEDINENEINNIDNEEDDQIIIEEDVETINKEEDEIVDNEIIEEVETETSINQELLDRVNTLLNIDITSITDIDELTNVYDNTNKIIDEYNESSEQANIDYESLLSFKYDVTKLLIDKHIESLPSEEDINTFTDVQNQIAPTRKLVRTTIPSLIDELNEIDQTNYNNNYASLLSEITTLLANRQKQIMNGEAVTATTRCGVTADWQAYSTNDFPTKAGCYYLTSDITSIPDREINSGTVRLDLNGHTITFDYTGSGRCPTPVYLGGGNLYLYDSSTNKTGKITRTSSTVNERFMYVQSTSSNFYMYGGTITNFTSESEGGAIYINGKFEMHGGTISYNTSSIHGGGVYVNGGTFTMTDGTISQNTAGGGGGVYVKAGTFNMSGGLITKNTGTGDGGGVYVAGGTFTMTGGTILDNTGKRGGGIFLWQKPKLVINGGTLGKNSATESGYIIYRKIGDGSNPSYEYKSGRLYAYTAANGYAICGVSGTSTITLDRNGSTVGTASISSQSWGSDLPNITSPTRGGYTFNGYTNSSGELYYNANGTPFIRNDVEGIKWDYIGNQKLTAKWTANKYTVILDNQSATTADSTSVTATYDSAMPIINVPTRTGFVFDGYYTGTNGSGTKYYNADGSSTRIWDIDSATTLYANWVDPVTKYAAKVNSNITDAYYDGEESYFTTFEAAMLAIKTNSLSNARVTLLQNVELTDQLNSTNSLFDNLTINLNGKTIKAAANNNFVCTNDEVSGERSLTIENGTVIHNSNSYCHIFGGLGSVIRITSNDVNYDDSYNKVKDNSSLVLGNVIAEFNGGFIDPSLNVEWQYQNYLQSIVSLKGDIYYPGTKFTITTENMVSSTTIYGGKYVYNPKSYGATIPDGYVVKDINEQKDGYTYIYQVVPGGNLTLNENGGSYVSGYSEPTKYEASNGLTLPTATQITKTGYTFKGWYVDSNFSGSAVENIDINTTGDKTYYAKWEANTNTAYKVNHYKQMSDSTYYVVPSETENKTGTTGENVTPDVKTYIGYTSPSAETKAILADGSLVFYYFYTRNKYSVKYDGNGSTSGSMSNSEHIYDVAKALTNNSYVKQYTVTYNANNGTCDKASDVANYTFAGWNTSANGNGTSYTNGQSVTNLSSTDGDVVTLYAQWNAGSVTLPSASRVGYEFDGWYDAETNGNKIGDAGSTYTPTIDITLYARWEISTSVINFDKQGGTGGSDSVTATYGSDMSLITSPTKEGFVFVGYFDAEEGGTQYYNADGSSTKNWDKTSDTTLYAHWNEIIPIPLPNYDLYYNSKRIPGVQPSPYYDLENGSAINVGTYTATVTPKDGYVWPDGTADPINISYTINKKYINSVASRIILKEIEDYAGKPIEPEVEKVITYDGIVLSPSDYTVTYSNNTMSDGYNGSQQASVHVTAKEDSNFEGTITREFLIKKALYTITFETFGGNVIEDMNVYYGSHVSYSDLPTPSKNGYKNPSGAVWYKDSECSTGNEWTYENDVVTSNITLYCKWVPVEYTISYDLDNGIANNPTTYTIETDSFTLNNPTKEGFVFSGWTGTDLLEKTTTVTIENGSCGNKEYVANYDKKIDVPSAIEGLIYNDTEQIGVEEGEGYTLTSNTATEAGNHTAIASLEDGYVWSDGTYEEKQIVFTIKNNRFEVSFDVLGSGTTGLPEGSIVESIEPKTVKLGETYGNMVKPTYVGYTFIGWFLGDIEITEESTVELTDNVTLVAHWNKIDALVKIASEDILANAIGYDGTYSYFDTLIKAVNSASENDELIIVKDFSNSFDSIKVNKSLTINIDNHTFNYYTINIDSGKTLTLTGNGGTLGGKVASSNSNTNINIDGDLIVSAIIDTSGSVQLINGTVSGELSVGASGSVNMTGGFFLTTNTYVYGETTITGGSFSESSKSFATWNNRMDKNQYRLVLNEETDFYDVIELEDVVSIGDIKYKTLATALQAAQDGDALVLLSDIGDIEEWGSFDFNKKISLDLNNHSITYNSGSRININNDVTINGEGTINCWVNVNNGTVTINDATLTKDVYIGEDSKEVVLNLNNVQNGDNSGYFYVVDKAEINIVDGKIRNLYARTNDLSKVKFNLSGNVYFEQIDFNNIPKENITITGGSYPYDVTQWLRDCYIATNTGHNSRHIVSEYVEASINTTKYKSFLEAYNAAQDGNTIKIERDLNFAAELEVKNNKQPLTISKNITIDTNGYRIFYTNNENEYHIITIADDVKFTGNGFVEANILVNNSGKLLIDNGTYKKTILNDGGELKLIKGLFYQDGIFFYSGNAKEINDLETYKIKMLPFVEKNTSHLRVDNDHLVVEPHHFVNHYCDTIIDGKECGAIDHDSVVAEVFNSNGVLVGQYFALKDAVTAAKTGETVKLLRDITLDQNTKICNVTFADGIIIDLNGKSIIIEAESGSPFESLTNKFTVKNGNIINENTTGYAAFYNCSDVTVYDVNFYAPNIDRQGEYAQVAACWSKVSVYGGTLDENVVLDHDGGDSITVANSTNGKFKYNNTKLGNEISTIIINGGLFKASIDQTNNLDNNHVVIDSTEQGYLYEVVEGGKITFETNGGSLENPIPTQYTSANGVELPIPTKDNYIFDGWYTDSDLSTKVTNTTSFGKDEKGSKTLYAKWLEPVASVNSNNVITLYASLQEALNNAESGDIVTLLVNQEVSTDLTIPEDVTLTFNEGTCLTINEEKTLLVNGTLLMPVSGYDPTVEMTLEYYNSVHKYLINNGTLEIGATGTFKSNHNNCDIVQRSNMKINAGAKVYLFDNEAGYAIGPGAWNSLDSGYIIHHPNRLGGYDYDVYGNGTLNYQAYNNDDFVIKSGTSTINGFVLYDNSRLQIEGGIVTLGAIAQIINEEHPENNSTFTISNAAKAILTQNITLSVSNRIAKELLNTSLISADISKRVVEKENINNAGNVISYTYSLQDLIKISIPTAITGLTYNGSKQIGVVEGTGYTLTNNTATNADTYTATAKLVDGYIWSDNTIEDKNITFTISPLSISNAEITLGEYDMNYCGTPIIPSITSVKVGDITLDTDDYEPTYSNNGFTETVDDSYDEKDAVVKVEAINSNFTESKELTYKIQRKAYSITLNLNGGHFESSEELPTTKLYGKPITIEHRPIKEGYSFVDYIDQENNHYSIGNQIETNKELQLKANWEIDETQWVAKVNNNISGYDNKNIVDGITYTYFNDLQTAIDNANGYTVTLLNNVTLTGNALEIATESEVTLDLNQKIIDANYLSNIFKVFGKLTIDDSSATTDKDGKYVAGKLVNGKFKEIPYKNGELYACGNAIYVDRGTLIINQGIIENCKTDESLTEGERIGARTGVVFGSSATITINGGLITNCSAGVGGAIFADYSNVTINGGTIENCKALEQDGQGAIKVYDNRTQFKASLTITGGTIRNCTAPAGSSGSVIYVSGTAVVNISGGTIIGAEGIEGDNFVKVHDQNNNYITGGWFSAPITSAADYYCVGPVSDAVDTNAPYTVTNKHYTITYKIKGESEDSYQEVYAPQGYSVKTILKEEPTKEGYVFDGWYLNEDYTGNKYSSVTEYEINENTTFYAKWDVDTTSEKWVAKVDKVKDNTTGVLSLDGLYYFDDLPTAIENAAENFTNEEAHNSTVTLLKDVELVGPIQQVPNNVIIDLNNKKISGATYTDNSVSDYTKDAARIFYQVANSFTIKNGTLENRALCGYAIFTDCANVKAYDINYTYTQHDNPSYTDPAQIAAFNTTLEIYGGSVEGNYVLTWTTSAETITINNSDKNKFFYKCTNYVKGGSPSITINGGLYATTIPSNYVNEQHVIIDANSEDKNNGYNFEVVEGGKITFVNEGTLPSGYSNPTIYTKESGISLPIPTRYEYVFDGWYTDSDLTTLVTNTTSFGQGETGPKTLYAKWITVIEAAVAKIKSNSRLTNAVGFENDYSYYDTLANAIKDATSAETKITLLKNIAEHNLTIEANQNVTLDLNGKTIDAENLDRLFVVRGSLTIDDSTATGDETNGTYVAGSLINGRSTGSGTVGSNDSELGNAIFVKGDGATLNINDGIIENCTMIAEKGSGNGTIYATGDNSEVRFNGGVIRNCTTLKGGAFYIAGSYFKMTGGAIINCESTYVGSQTEGSGAINLFCNTSLITGGLISGCEAAGKCGGIQIKIAKLTITGGVFENCTGGDVTRGQLIDVINDDQNRYLLVNESTGIIGSSLEITGGTFVGADNAKTNDLIHISSNDENKITGGWYSGDITPNENYGVVGPIDNAPDARAPYTVTNSFYTITYDSNGGNAINPEKIYSLPGHSVETTVMNEVPTKDYETFTGWNTMADGTGTTYVAGDVITLTDSITLYAQWQEQTAVVNIHSKAKISGTTISNVGQMIGGGDNIIKNKLAEIKAIDNENSVYRFDHWEIDGEEVGSSTTLQYKFTKDVTDVYAVFRYDPQIGIRVHVEAEKPFTMRVLEKQSWLFWEYYIDGEYNVNVTNANGLYDKEITVVAGSSVELSYAGDDFEAWTSRLGMIQCDNPTYKMDGIYIEKDITLKLNEAKENEYYAKYMVNDTQMISSGEFTDLATLKSMAPSSGPGKIGYEFIDWIIGEIELSTITTTEQLIEVINNLEITDKVVELKPSYNKVTKSFNVTIMTLTSDSSTPTQYGDPIVVEEGNVTTIEAPEITDMKFAYWTLGSDIVSYNEKYNVKIVDDVTYVANYKSTQEEKKPTITASVTKTGTGNGIRVAFIATRDVPNNKDKYQIVENGVIYSTQSSWSSYNDTMLDSSLRFSSVDEYGNVKLKSGTKKAVNTSNSFSGNYTLTLGAFGHENNLMYLRGYMLLIVYDETNKTEETKIIYTDLYKVSYNTVSNPYIVKTTNN